MTDEYYSPDNLTHIYPYLSREPKWLLLGGPADAREAQTAVEKWPGIRVVGVDPNPEVIAWQAAHGWPDGHPLLWAALSNQEGVLSVKSPPGALRSGRVEEQTETSIQVRSVTWDALDSVHGPFEDAILWMDIETWELEALQGAAGLLARQAIILVNVEMQARVRDKNREIQRLLKSRGFRPVHEWNASAECWDRIYVRS